MISIQDIILCNLFIFGIYITTRRGMALNFLVRWIEHIIFKRKLAYQKSNQILKNLWEDGYSLKTTDSLKWDKYNSRLKETTRLKRRYKILLAISQPIYICLPCMSLPYGTIYFLFTQQIDWHLYPIFILALVPIGFLIQRYL